MQVLDRIWETHRMFQEPVCFTEMADGTITGGKLLFSPDTVESVTSSDESITYVAGRDYIIQDGCLVRTPESTIPVLGRDVYCKPYDGAKERAWLRLPGGETYLTIFPETYKYQILVTYTHQQTWDALIPAKGSSALSRSFQKLQSGGAFHLMFYGDSITAGWEASGCDEEVIHMQTLQPFRLQINRPPYLPSWAELVTRTLREAFPAAEIQKVNRGAGGSTTAWGVAHAKELVSPHRPDLVVLAFGMNSLCAPVLQHRAQIETIMRTIRKTSPDCDFVLVSPMVPSQEIAGFLKNTLAKQEQALFDIAKSEPGVAVAPVHMLTKELLRKGKTYYELTGNCINHPNDFSVRMYAQTILTTLGL